MTGIGLVSRPHDWEVVFHCRFVFSLWNYHGSLYIYHIHCIAPHKEFVMMFAFRGRGHTECHVCTILKLGCLVWSSNPDSKVHGANMGPIWGRQDPGGPHVGPMNFAIWEYLRDHFANYFSVRIEIRWTIPFGLIQILPGRSLQNIAHDTAVVMPLQLQSFLWYYGYQEWNYRKKLNILWISIVMERILIKRTLVWTFVL